MLKRLISAALTALLLAAPAAAQSWDSVAQKAQRSVGRLATVFDWPEGHMYHGKPYFCSFWMWNSDLGVAITAKHCFDPPGPQPPVRDVTVNLPGLSGEATILFEGPPGQDYAFIQSDVLKGAPALRPAPRVTLGDEVLIYGWAYGTYPYLRTGIASLWGSMGDDVPLALFLDQSAVQGMSGGVALDREGRAIGVLVMANNRDDLTLVLEVATISVEEHQ